MADSATDPRVGTTLKGKWKLDRLLGMGGMASVYAASHRNGATAAIKILHPDFARMAEVRTRFLREGYIANQAGPGAVSVFDDDVDDDGSPYLIMELLRGEVVDSRAERMGGRLPLAEVLWVAAETLSALETAHASNIIHRDLKPENLFWVAPDRIKVLDFGIARLRDATNVDDRTRAGLVMGTPGFMAPEQALGVAEADARTDLFAVGAIMYRLLTGQELHNFTDMNVLVIVATARAKPVASVEPSVPKNVAEIVDRALQFRREDRFQSAREMRERIEAIKSPTAVAPRALMPPPPPPPAVAPQSAPPPRAVVAPTAPPTPRVLPLIEPSPESSPMSHGFTSNMSEVDTFLLSEILAHITEVGRLQKELGAAHPRAVVKFEEVFAEASAALATAHIGLFWNVEPEGYIVRQILILKAPVSVKMHAGGVRMLGLLPELSREELEWVVRLLSGDVSPFNDFATFLQSTQLEHLVYRLDVEKPDMPETLRASLCPPSWSEDDVPSILSALPTSDAATRAALLSRLERRGTGHEAQIGAAAGAADEELAVGLLRVLHAQGTADARAALVVAARSTAPMARLYALSSLDDPNRFNAELRTMLGRPDEKRRLDALSGIAMYRIKAASAALALRVESAAFVSLGEVERSHTLATLEALSSARAEGVGVQLLNDPRIEAADKHGSTRRLACELLGRIGVTKEARDILLRLANGRRSSEGVRAAAALALPAFDARASARAAEATGPRSRAPSRPNG